MKRCIILAVVASTCLLPNDARADMTFTDGKVHVIDSAIDEAIWVGDSPSGDFTTVNIVSGGSVNATLTAVDNSRINMLGGSAEHIGAYTNSKITVSGGTIKVLDALTNSTITILGGLITEELAAVHNSQVSISGGTIQQIMGWSNSQINISDGLIFGLNTMTNNQTWILGGTIQNTVYTYTDSQLFIGGGMLSDISACTRSRVDIMGGLIDGGINVFDHGLVTIHGNDFNYPFGPIFDTAGTLTGTLTSGDLIDVGFYRGFSTAIYDYHLGTIELVPVPSTVLLTAVGLSCAGWWLRRKI